MKNQVKNYFILAIFATFSFVSLGQDFKKGNLLGLHSGTLKLAPNVSKEQYINFFKQKLKPALEKEFECKVILVESVRGKNANQLGFIWLFTNDAKRNKIYKSEGVYTEFGQNAMNKVQKTIEEWNKLGKIESTYTDWSVL